MSEGFAIELHLDPALENQVLKAWNVLARRQITTHLIEMKSRPHITLFSAPFLEPSKLESLLRTFASKHDPLSLSFSSVGTFPNHADNLLFLAPTPSLSLLQFQSHLCDAIRKEGIEISDDFAFDSWIPYCSVAHHVAKNQMPERDVRSVTGNRQLEFPQEGESLGHSVFGDVVCDRAVRYPGIEGEVVGDLNTFFSDGVAEVGLELEEGEGGRRRQEEQVVGVVGEGADGGEGERERIVLGSEGSEKRFELGRF
ncbi:hypothetical protein VIGAN_11021900 [Vigna angularis var. angularis]|uniref:Uncharacterized protein n=1 Tax=Vigna angularis var. angularis TaxID=157739 RepID=A0A0S3T731_PHAAN|nr:hypothetical protein VIGAN_11021900 [Vigna angularis var. angularis]